MLALAIFIVISVFILPEWFSIIFLYLAVRIVSGQLEIPSLLTFGEIDILVADLVIIAVASKVFLRGALVRNGVNRLKAVFMPGMVAFLTVMMLSIFVSYMRFGYETFIMELVPFLRFLGLQICSFLLFVVALRNLHQIQSAYKAVHWLGYLVTMSIYLGLLLYPHGITVGEINPSESFTRYQGLLGDSVKLFLLPFIFFEVLSGRLLGAAFLSTGLLATGGRLGFIGLLVGLVVLIVIERGKMLKAKDFIAFCSLIIALSIGLWWDIGGMATRFKDPLEISVGMGQRVETWRIAFTMARENFLAGLGFGGYRLFVQDYQFASHGDFVFFVTETFSQMLKAVVDGGVLGLAAFLWMMWNFLTVMGRSMSITEGELYLFLKSGYILIITLIILSPFVTWLLPASTVSYLMLMFVGIGIRVLLTKTNQPLFVFGNHSIWVPRGDV
jgi:O-antigen ligase